MGQVAPVITSVSIFGGTITVKWTDASTNILVTNYVVLITQLDPNKTPWGNYSAGGPVFTLSFVPSPKFQFNPAYGYSAQVFGYSSENPNGLGSTGCNVANVIQAPTITSVACDGEQVVVNWTDPTPYPWPNQYVFILTTPSGKVNVATSDELTLPQWTFAMPPGSPVNGTYTLELFGQYTFGTGFGPASTNTVNVIMQAVLPQAVVTASATAVAVTWPAATSGGVTAYNVVMTSQGVVTASAKAVTGTNTTLTLTSSLVASSIYEVMVQATGTNTAGPIGPPVAVIVGAPAIQSMAYTFDGELALTWSSVLGPSVSGYAVTVTPASGTALNFTTAQTSITVPVDPAVLQGATVAVGAIGFNCSGPTASATPIATAPEITGVSYSAGVVTATWSISSAPSDPVYELALFDGGTLIRSSTSGNTATGGTVSSTLSSGRAYTVRGRVTSGAAIGPWSGDVAVIVGTPSISRAIYDGTNLTLTWTAVSDAGVTAYSVTTGGTTVLANGTSVTIPIELAAGATAQVTAIGPASTGAAGASLPLVTVAPEISAVSYASGKVTATWTAPTGTTYELALFDGGGFIVSNTTGNTATTASITSTLTAGRAYTVRGRVTSGAAIGPWSGDVPVIVGTPSISSAVYDGTNLTLTWTAVSDAGVTAYSVTTGGTTILANGTSATIPIELAAGATAQVTAIGPASTGAAGASLPLVTVAPEISAVSYASGKVTATWTAPTGTTYELALFDGGGFIASNTTGNTATTASITSTLTAGRAYTVRGRVISANAIGPWSGEVPVIVGAPSISSAIYDGTNLTLTWTAVSDAGVTAYSVTTGGTTILANGTSVTIPIELAAGATAQVTAIGPASTGAAGASLPLVTVAPEISAVSYASGTVTATWTAPTGTTYELALFDGGGFIASNTTDNTATSASITSTLPAGRAYTVRGRVISGNAIGPWSGEVPVIVGAPSISSAVYDGTNLTLTWTAVNEPGVLAYIVTVGSTTLTVAGPSLTLPEALAAGSSTTVTISAAGPASSGPQATTTIAVPATLQLGSVTYDGSAITAKWTALTASVTGYIVTVSIDYQPAFSVIVSGATSASTTINAILDPSAVVLVTVTPVNGGITGEISAPLPVITSAPQLENVFYNGTTINASWSAIDGPSGLTYTLALMNGTTTVTSITTSGTSGQLTPASFSAGNLVVVTPVIGATSTGPASTGVDPTTGAAEFFFSPTNTTVPYSYRSTARPPLPSTPAAVTLYFPNIFTGAAPSNPPPGLLFTLASVSNAGQIAYSIAVDPSVWTFSTTSIRATLRSSFLSFMEWLEPALLPGAALFVRRALALGMPLSFAETLLYRYGFAPQSGYIDLLPGMSLRLDGETYQYFPQQAQAGLVGFTGTGSAEYDIVQGPLGANGFNLAFDGFLSLLTSTTVTAAQAGGGGGIIDLYGSGGAKPYFRLFYPTAFPASDSQGFADPSDNVAIVGATSIAAMEGATTQYLQQGNFNNIASANVSVYYLRGRVVALPKISVMLNGAPLSVAVGTTLRGLVGSWANLPVGELFPMTSVSLVRPTGGVLDSSNAFTSLPAVQAEAFNFSDQTLVTYPGSQDWFDVPLIGGDVIELG